jgi:hypothetical protein
MDGIFGHLPKELHQEIYFQGSVEQYIKKCTTDKASFQKCMTSNHWLSYMKGKSPKDILVIIKFTSNYLPIHPNLFIDVVQRFFIVYDTEITEGLKTIAAKSKTKKLDDFQQILVDIGELITRSMKLLVSVDFTEEKYGFIEDIQTSPMGVNYMKLSRLDNRLRMKQIANLNANFLEEFVDNVRIKDRHLDSSIRDIAPIWYALIDQKNKKKDPYSKFQIHFGRYMEHNFASHENGEWWRESAKFFAAKMEDEDERENAIGGGGWF